MLYYEKFVDASKGFTFFYNLEILKGQPNLFLIQSESNKQLVSLSDLKIKSSQSCVFVEFVVLHDFESTLLTNIFTESFKHTIYLTNFSKNLVIGTPQKLLFTHQFKGLVPYFVKVNYFDFCHKKENSNLSNLNPEYLLENLVQTLGHSMPFQTTYFLAHRIIMHSIGTEFWAKECTTKGDPQDFFKDQTQGQKRVVLLAQHLWDLRNCKNFEHQLSKCRREQNFEKTFHELLAANLLYQISEEIQFNVESGTKGDDYDLIAINLFEYDRINIEVKSKDEPFKSPKSFENYFGKYKKQLNKEYPGAFFCKVVNIETFTIDELIEGSKKFLSKTSRIKFIIFYWEVDQGDISTFHYLIVDKNGPMNVYLSPLSPEHPNYISETLELASTKLLEK